jgi:DNA topoisomerase-3
MITIYAEKPDVGKKIAAALDKITLAGGQTVSFEKISAYDKAIKAQQFKDGYLLINYNGQKTYVTWGYGHLCELKQAYDYDEDYKNWKNIPLPFIPSSYDVKVKDTTAKQFAIVKKLLNSSDYIINATDFDREGNLIFEYLMRAANCKKPHKRVCLTSQTKEGFLEAFADLKTPEQVKPITDAGVGRSIADWVIGSNLTVAMSLKYNSGILSIGRVQTPTLNMLVKRTLAIKTFVSTPYYTINAVFKTANGDEYTAEHKTKKFEIKSEAEEIVSSILGYPGKVKSIDKKITKKEAPSLYNLSALQMDANSKYGFTLAKTLQVAQELYEAGFTTYPRTDSQFLTEDMPPVIDAVLDSLSKIPEYTDYIQGHTRYINQKKYFNNSKVTSHYAIIPTKVIPSNLSEDQRKIYDLIARSVIMMIYDAAQIEKTTVTTEVNGQEFVSNGSIMQKPGWTVIDKGSKDTWLPDLSIGDIVQGTYKINDKMTEPPKPYTDKTLVSAMISAGKELDDEELKKYMESGVQGIGTEATRAAIIEALIKRGYAERSGKKIVATEKGIALINILPLSEIKSAELTAKWEYRLNEIANGRDNLNSFIKDIENVTKDWCEKITSVSSSPDVFTNSTSRGEADLICPVCGSPISKKNWGWGCTNYKNGCKFTVNAVIAGKKLTDAQVKKLITKGQTSVIKGFKSKAGKSFDAALAVDENFKVVFVFS